MRKLAHSFVPTFIFLTCLAGCGGGASSSTTSSTSSSTSSGSSSSTGSSYSSGCSESTNIGKVVCEANSFLALLSESEKSTVLLSWDNSSAKTTWSNLPSVTRNGLRFGDLNTTTRAAAMAIAKAALSDAGYTDFQGILAADDYLAAQGGGSAYSADNYYIAFIGTPSVSGNWMLQIGGHHLAYNITYLAGTGYPVPHHIGAEPKASFEINSTTYAPLVDEGNAMVAMFTGLSSTQLSSAYLSGETYADVLVGPDNGSSVLPTDYPTGSNRRGVLVSSLDSTQKALVIAAIRQWVADYNSDVSERLMSEYTSDAALADTYIAWAGTQSQGVNVDVSGTYMRIDGPRLWIEVACQGGLIIRNKTHYHTVYRDKTMDYGNSL